LSQGQSTSLRRPRWTALLGFEDLLLVGWVAIASPLGDRLFGRSEPFQSGHPLLGLMQLGSVLAALAALVIRRPASEARTGGRVVNGAFIGPLTGGLLLVTISGFTSLDAPQALVLGVIAVAVVGAVLVRALAPPLSALVRRALMSPLVLVTGGIFWSFIDAVSGPGKTGVFGLPPVDLLRTPVALLFFAAFSAVYYAMLVYAPRQAADPEGSFVAWLLRYAVFVIGVIFGLGWLSALGS